MAREIGFEIKKCLVWKVKNESATVKTQPKTTTETTTTKEEVKEEMDTKE